MHSAVETAIERVEIDDVRAALKRDGYYVAYCVPRHESADDFILRLARSLGELYVAIDCDPAAPLIRTAPTSKRHAPPFDRPEAIGWHGDFATYEDRPELSIVYIIRPDPRGGDYGAWRLASVEHVLAELRATDEGRTALDFLGSTPLPFSYSDDEAPRQFVALEPRSEGRTGLRFYLPSIRRGCLAVYGEVPVKIASALAQIERAADQVGRVVPTREGSLLVASNWFALHDRVRQTISRTHAKREALLCFVRSTAPRSIDLSPPSDPEAGEAQRRI
jgi:hypothetical protein